MQHFRSWLIEGTQAGDSVFFMYSGHGFVVPDPQGLQVSDPDDTQLDVENKGIKNLLFDYELQLLLQELAGRKVLLWVDSWSCRRRNALVSVIIDRTAIASAVGVGRHHGDRRDGKR